MNGPIPKTLLVSAAIITGLFLFVHVADLRSLTSLLSGTMPGSEAHLLMGLAYILLWFSVIVVAPILALAGGLHLALMKLAARRRRRADGSRGGPRQDHHAAIDADKQIA